MNAGRIVAAVLGSILALAALGMLIGGGVLLWGHQTLLDEDGFYSSPAVVLESEGHAIVADGIDLASHPGEWWPSRLEATVQLQARSLSGQELFVAVAPKVEVDRYLADVEHSVIDRMGQRGRVAELSVRAGGAPGQAPDAAAVWTRSVQGADEQTLTWDLQRGRWSVVVMNADASSPMSVSVVARAKLPILYPISVGLLVAGFALASLAAVLLVIATRGAAKTVQPERTIEHGAYPLTLTGSIDRTLSPVLWLIKWFLLIPHFVVLGLLWAAFVVLTAIAWISILFTGRYPRGLFDFNVGVLRWTWRVMFYGYSALATDQYPPFTLQDVEYPARLTVAYPSELSRGLALIKWWLLAIPHYLIVGLFTTGLWSWTVDHSETGKAVVQLGGGLILLLALVAAFALLFTGRYPRGLFDLLMGLNRWVLRVGSYVALMHDEYPPFRLDMGGAESPHDG
jgi:hypothetical protein